MSAASTLAPWGRVHVVRGERPRQIAFTSGAPARVVIGSEASNELCLRGPEVAPRQLDLVWDGANLWIEDALRLGRTFVNGHLLNEWVAILGHAVVSFGPMRLWLAAGGAEPVLTTPNFMALERASVVPPQVAEERRRNTARLTVPPEVLEAWAKGEGAA